MSRIFEKKTTKKNKTSPLIGHQRFLKRSYTDISRQNRGKRHVLRLPRHCTLCETEIKEKMRKLQKVAKITRQFYKFGAERVK